MICCSANPLIGSGTDAAASLHWPLLFTGRFSSLNVRSVHVSRSVHVFRLSKSACLPKSAYHEVCMSLEIRRIGCGPAQSRSHVQSRSYVQSCSHVNVT